MYDSTIGRWISQAPLGFDAGDGNLYRCVSHQPQRLLDPSGLGPVVAFSALAWNDYSRGKDDYAPPADDPKRPPWETARIKAAIGYESLSVSSTEMTLRLMIKYTLLVPRYAPPMYAGYSLFRMSSNLPGPSPYSDSTAPISLYKHSQQEVRNGFLYEYRERGDALFSLGVVTVRCDESMLYAGALGVTHGDPAVVVTHARQRINWSFQIDKGSIAKAEVIVQEFDRTWNSEQGTVVPNTELIRLIASSYLPANTWQTPFRPKNGFYDDR